MIVYLTLAISPLLIELFFPNLNNDKYQKRKFFIVCGILMFLVMGFRSHLLGSVDTLNYWNRYLRAVESKSWLSFYGTEQGEVGFLFVVYILSRFLYNPQWLLIVTSLFYIISVLYYINNNSKDVALSLLLFIALGLFTFEMQGMRQGIAMSICLFAYEQAKKRRIVPFALLVVCAILFHQTAIVFIVVYFLCRLKFSRRSVTLILLVSVVVLFFSDRIIAIANFLFDKDYVNAVDSGGFVAVAIYVIAIIFTLIYDNNLKKGNEQTPALYMLLIGFASYLMRYFGAQAAERISFYFMFAQILLLPNASNSVLKEQKNAMRWIIAVLAVVLFAYRLNGSELVPYRFCWQLI